MIRAAQPLDAGAAGTILSEFVDTTPWMPRVHTRAEDLRHMDQMIARDWVHVICDAGVAGFIARDRDMVHALYVSGGRRGAGLGKALLDHAKTQTDRLTLWTFQANDGARRFYDREGFTEIARTDGAGNDEGLPDLQLHWERTSA